MKGHVRDIVQEGHPALGQVALEVPREDIAGKEIPQIIADLKATLAQEKHGVAIAAPQIGVSLRIFVVAGKVFASRKGDSEKDAEYADVVYINPTITSSSKKKRSLSEGCLSVRGYWGEVERHERVTIEALGEDGEKIKRGASGLLAQIFQHEVDHLNGILYTQHATRVVEDTEEHPIHE